MFDIKESNEKELNANSVHENIFILSLFLFFFNHGKDCRLNVVFIINGKHYNFI